jgi:RHS repeat-associated protein
VPWCQPSAGLSAASKRAKSEKGPAGDGSYVDELLAILPASGVVGDRKFVHSNHLYSVAALTDNSGNVVERYRYDAYGQRTVLAADGTTVRAASSYGNQVGFTGRYQDKETSLWYFRARYYSGGLGRFVNRDPYQTEIDTLQADSAFEKKRGTTLMLSSISGKMFNPLAGDGYQDSMSLYQGSFIPNRMDPYGEAPCDVCCPGRVFQVEEKVVALPGCPCFDVADCLVDMRIVPGTTTDNVTYECHRFTRILNQGAIVEHYNALIETKRQKGPCVPDEPCDKEVTL